MFQQALAGFVAQPVDVGEILGLGGRLDLVEDGWVELQKRGEPVVAGEVGFAAGEFLAREGAEFGEDAEIVEKALGQAGLQEGLAEAIEASLLEGPEGGEEIAAVDRRDELRR